jgi:hypothetical protein
MVKSWVFVPFDTVIPALWNPQKRWDNHDPLKSTEPFAMVGAVLDYQQFGGWENYTGDRLNDGNPNIRVIDEMVYTGYCGILQGFRIYGWFQLRLPFSLFMENQIVFF